MTYAPHLRNWQHNLAHIMLVVANAACISPPFFFLNAVYEYFLLVPCNYTAIRKFSSARWLIDIRLPSSISACVDLGGLCDRANGTFIYYGHLDELRSRALLRATNFLSGILALSRRSIWAHQASRRFHLAECLLAKSLSFLRHF